jgi:carboxyl-terminal processing protease
MKKLLFFSIVFMVLFISCKKDNDNTDNAITPEMARDSLYYIMKEFYYWYNMPESAGITESNLRNYADPYELLEAMRYRAVDRWSFVTDYDAFMAVFSQGTYVGHGFNIGLDDSKKVRIVLIYKNSALYASGVRRGWIIKKVNNTDPAPILISGDATAIDNLVGPPQSGVSNTFVFQRPDGTDTTIYSTKSTFKENTVHVAEILQLSSGPTGHLVFDSFITPSIEELATAFASFKANNIKDLILDLRYNWGGYLAIAQKLASYIAGDSKQGSVFAKLKYNDKHQDDNYTYLFVATPYSLDLSRIVVITSHGTASASEAVMNGLRPFVNVVSIGDTTEGKPTGNNSWSIGKKYVMMPVTFKMVNSQNEGEYYNGFSPAKVVPDDITHDFSDREELCLKEAIYYLEHGSVSTKGVQEFKRYPVFSEKLKWLNNVFINSPPPIKYLELR